MVSMAMCNVDRRQVLVLRGDPICQGTRLLDGHEGIDEDRIPLPIDEGRRHRLEVGFLNARRAVASDDRNARSHENFPPQAFRLRTMECIHPNHLSLLESERWIC